MESLSPLPVLAFEAAAPAGPRAQRIAQIKFVALSMDALADAPAADLDAEHDPAGDATGTVRATFILRALLRRIGIRAT